MEMGVTTVMEKPTKRDDFLNGLAWTVSQARRPSEAKTLESRIRALLKAGKIDEAARAMQMLNARAETDGVGGATLKQLEAEFAFQMGDFVAARDLAMASLQAGGKSVLTLNLLGKTLMQLREFGTALSVFERANELSPDSIERLCATAETQSALGDDTKAMTTLDQAAKLDQENQAVINASVNIGLATGNAELAKGMLDRVRPTDSVLAYINNRAVAYAKAGNFKESIKLYKNALEAIPKEKDSLRAVVLYNLALAQIRDGDLNGAIDSLQAVGSAKDQNLDKKVRSLLERGREAQASGVKLKLNVKDDQAQTIAAGESRFAKLAKTFAGGSVKASPPGERICLHGIFMESGPPSHLVEALLASPPKIAFQKQPG
jgi:tetratricopeptide (TPR) repeat protein